MDAEALLEKYAGGKTEGWRIVRDHSRLVADAALRVARRLALPDDEVRFVEEAALLHDIGVFATDAPSLSCHGSEPYLRHGLVGKEWLEQEGLPRHALVCERHIGVGITARDVREQKLPLPERDMVPLNLAEEIVCYADLFFSKGGTAVKGLDDARRSIARFGDDKAAIFDEWFRRFGSPHE